MNVFGKYKEENSVYSMPPEFFFEFFEFLNRHTNTHMAIAVQEILKFMEL